MLQTLRNHSHKWFAKILFGILVLSFGMWGIADIIYKFINNKTIASAGSHDITYDEFNLSLKKEISNLSQSLKINLTDEQLRAINIEKIVINKMINDSVLSQKLTDFDFVISDENLKDKIKQINIFQVNNQFSPQAFDAFLKNQYLSEKMFIDDLRKNILSQQLLSTLAQGSHLPKIYKKILDNVLMQQKIFTCVFINTSDQIVQTVAKLSDYEKFYTENSEIYTVPETRDVSVIHINKETFKKLLNITDEMVKNFYNEHKNELKYPEKRNVIKISVNNLKTANDLCDFIKKNELYQKIDSIKSLKQFQDVVINNLGFVFEKQLPEELAKKLFADNNLSLTKPINSGATYDIFVVTKIEKSHIASFDEAKDEIEDVLIEQNKANKLDEFKIKIDDMLAAGKVLADVAKELNLEVKTYKKVTKNGIDQQNKQVVIAKNNIKNNEFIEKIFSLEKHVDSGFLEVQSEGAFIIMNDEIYPSYLPKFSEIENKIKKDYLDNEKNKLAMKKAMDIVENCKNIEELASYANKNNLSLFTNNKYNRMSIGQRDQKSKDTLPDSLLEKAFSLPKHGSTFGKTKLGYTVIMFEKDGQIVADENTTLNINKNLDTSLNNDCINLIVKTIRDSYKVKINEKLLERVIN